MFRILTLNLAFWVSLKVKSLVSINDFITTVFDMDSVVLGLVTVIGYVPGFKLIASVATPFALVLTEVVLPFILNFTAAFFRSFPFLS